jgi:hypothetical protein
MENVLIVAVMTTFVFCAFKFLEIRFLDKQKEMKPLKFFVRDMAIVFASS